VRAAAETAPTEPTTAPTGVAIFAEDFQTSEVYPRA
jgi:hypothetical protein